MRTFLRNNSLSIVFLVLFVFSLLGQILTGFTEYNKEQKEEHQETISIGAYLQSGHFIQATFENWESEFLQMALFVVYFLCFLFVVGKGTVTKGGKKNMSFG